MEETASEGLTPAHLPGNLGRLKIKKTYEVMVNLKMTVCVDVEAETPDEARNLDWKVVNNAFLEADCDAETGEEIA